MSHKIEKILLPKELTPDSIVSLAIAYKYGQNAFSGLSSAKLEFRASLPKDKDMNYFITKGVLPLIPLHEDCCVLRQISEYEDLELDKYPVVNQTIASLKYDKNVMFKRGAIFTWGYLTKILKDNPEKALKLILPVLKECIDSLEERRKMFFEYCSKAIQDDRLLSFNVKQSGKTLKVVFVDYENQSIAEYLFYKKEVLADVIAIFKNDGSIFIKSKDEVNVDLMDVVAILRMETARKCKIPFDKINKHILNRKGLMEGLEYWEFEALGNVFRSVKPTHLDKLVVKKAMLIGLDNERMAKGECPPKEGCVGKKCSLYSFNMLRCRKRRAGLKDTYSHQNNGSNSKIRVYRQK